MIDLDPLKIFSPCSDSRTRGHDFKLCFNFSRLIVRNKFFSQRVVHHWNSLSYDCVNASSLPSFKQALPSILIGTTAFTNFSSPHFIFCLSFPSQ